jgi:DNA-binding GntR family transcriptional regulator
MAEPRYREIAEDLRQQIESGELGHGDQLPTELELRERYDSSRNTVRDAVKWLTSRSLTGYSVQVKGVPRHAVGDP